MEYETVYPYRRLCRGYRLLRLRACGLTDHGRAPESIGPVTVNRERIGTGQPFTATCVIPADGHNISSVEYLWGIRPAAEQVAADVTRTSPVEPTVESYDFRAPSAAGSYVISCTARYIFGAPDAGGALSADVTGEARIEVVPCDVLRSFWGDSMQETELNYPGLTAQGEDALVGMVYDPLQSGQPNIVTGFQFTDGRLARILQTEGRMFRAAAVSICTTCCCIIISRRGTR